MGKRSRDKGKRGEREVVKLYAELWPDLDFRRGLQSRRGDDDPDIVGAPHRLWTEVKRGQSFRLRGSLRQAEEASPDDALPIVVCRRDRAPWHVYMRWETLQALIRAARGET